MRQLFGEVPVGKQLDVLNAFADPRITEIYVPSCHDSGKTFICARCLILFLLGRPHNSIVVSTAPTWQQVEMLLWREVRSAYAKAKFPIGGQMLTTRLEFGPKWYGIGIATAPGTAVNIQGFHADNILVIIDEADGVSPDIWTAVDGLTTTYGAKVLAIGNPLDPQSEFKKRHDLALSKPNAKVIRISADDIPNIQQGKIVYPFLLSPGWVQDKLILWGPESALAMGKIRAQWPDQGPDTLIPMSLLQRAKGRDVKRGARSLGVDVARFGRDRTVRTLFEGGWLDWQKVMTQSGLDIVAGAVIADAMAYTPAGIAIDAVGIGAGVADLVRARVGEKYPVIDFNAGSKPHDEERFVNRGTEAWVQFRKGLEDRAIGFNMDRPDEVDTLINELNRAKFTYDERGRMKIDKFGMPRGKTTRVLSDEELAARSPDLADSAVLGYVAGLPFANLRDNSAYASVVDWYAGTAVAGRRI